MDGPILITGASGFVGANLCREFARLGFPVVAVEGPSRQDWRMEGFPGAQKINIDLTDEKAVRQCIADIRPTAVFNLAAYGAFSHQRDVDRIYRVNFHAVRTLLEAVAELSNFKAFIQAGSSSEYGMNCAAPSESAATIPDSDYAVSKAAASSLVQYFGKKRGVPAWSLRLYSVYGSFEDPTRLIPKLLLHAKAGKLPPLVNPNISRDFIHVSDVMNAFATVFDHSEKSTRGEIYNIGTGIRTSLQDLVAVVRKNFGVTEDPAWGSMPNRHWDHTDWYANPAKACGDLGWKATKGLESGLDETMEWLDENQALLGIASYESARR